LSDEERRVTGYPLGAEVNCEVEGDVGLEAAAASTWLWQSGPHGMLFLSKKKIEVRSSIPM
jgi:hypothetical protein